MPGLLVQDMFKTGMGLNLFVRDPQQNVGVARLIQWAPTGKILAAKLVDMLAHIFRIGPVRAVRVSVRCEPELARPHLERLRSALCQAGVRLDGDTRIIVDEWVPPD